MEERGDMEEEQDLGQIWTEKKQQLLDKWRADYINKNLEYPDQEEEDNEWERLFYMKYLKENE